MTNTSNFRKLTISDFFPDFEEEKKSNLKKLFKLSYSHSEWAKLSEEEKSTELNLFLEDDERSYDLEWFGSQYDQDSVGGIEFHYGVHTKEKLVAIQVSKKSEGSGMFAAFSPKSDPVRDQQIENKLCKELGVYPIGSNWKGLERQVVTKDVESIGKQGCNGYSSFYIFKNGILYDYTIKDDEIVMWCLYDPELILENNKGNLSNLIECVTKDMAEELDDDDCNEEYIEQIEHYTEELNELKAIQINNLSKALKCIYIDDSDESTEVEEDDSTPAWIHELNEKDPDVLFQFFMNVDMSILDELEEKQYEVKSFDELVAYKDQLINDPSYLTKVASHEDAMLGKKKIFSKKKLRKKFRRDILEDIYCVENFDDGDNLRELIGALTDDHIHNLRSNIGIILRIDTTMKDWKDVVTISDALEMLGELNVDPSKQGKEAQPQSATKLQQQTLQNTMEQSMREINTMMKDAMKGLE